jgi:hypothetical protein
MNLSESLATHLGPLFEALPLDRAMPQLVPASDNRIGAELGSEQYEHPLADAYKAAAHVCENLNDHPTLQAAIWLYVDDLERSHRISQTLETPAGAFWHGIMHRREGDFSNAKYWFREAGSFGLAGHDPFWFVDEVERRHRENPAELVELQRKEWAALFERCAKEAG